MLSKKKLEKKKNKKEDEMRNEMESPPLNNCRGMVKIDFQYKSLMKRQAAELEPKPA